MPYSIFQLILTKLKLNNRIAEILTFYDISINRINILVENFFCCRSICVCTKNCENKTFELNNSNINSILTLYLVKHARFAIFDQSMIDKASPRNADWEIVSSNYRDHMNNMKIQRGYNQNKHVAHYRRNFADRLARGDNE